MADDVINMDEIQTYITDIIPTLERKLAEPNLKDDELSQTYILYRKMLCLVAPYDFISFNKYLEIDEDKNDVNKGFYYHRKECLKDMFEALNDMEMKDAYDTLLVSCPPRVGKALAMDENVLTPTGWVKMRDIKLDDLVIGGDGKPTKVIGVFPQGIRDTYLVTFSDGTTVHCDKDHLWEVQTRDDRKLGKSRVVTTESMLHNLYVENGKRKNYSISYVNGIEFKNTLTDYDIKPYTLGALLGDGGLSGGNVKFTNIDEDVLNRIENELPKGDILKRISNSISYDITKERDIRNEKGYPVKCHTHKKLCDYGVFGTNSHTKFIPKQYLYSSFENRLALLRGLMDTDGYTTVKQNCSYNEFSTVSKQLSEDVLELVRSLGGHCNGIKQKMGKLNGIEKSTVYRISFTMEVNPFYCERKYKVFCPRKQRCYKYITSIEPSGRCECQCIMVDSPTHLFVANGYNITHNTTCGVRFLSWIMGRHPTQTQLATSYSDSITTSFYIGVMEVVQSQQFKDVFPDACLVGQNAKREEIWLKSIRRYPSISFVPINGSMTGRAEAGNYLYCDDLVSGIEEAMSVPRLEKLWQTYSVNARQRKKSNAKEIHIATRWSVHDPITTLEMQNTDNPRCKSIKIPCFDENGESNFDFEGGFSKQYYIDQKNSMDEISFNALYMQEPIEREGLLYHADELQYYFDLPQEPPDTIIAVCDSKNLGTDNVSCPVGYVYGDTIYLEDVVFNNGLPEVTRPMVANCLAKNKVVRADVEMNNGGNYYAEDLQKMLKDLGAKTSIRMFFTSSNKMTKIITYSDFVKKNFVFKHPSTYKAQSDYGKFMKNVFSFSQVSKANKHDKRVRCCV